MEVIFPSFLEQAVFSSEEPKLFSQKYCISLNNFFKSWFGMIIKVPFNFTYQLNFYFTRYQTWASPGTDSSFIDEVSLWVLISKASRAWVKKYMTRSRVTWSWVAVWVESLFRLCHVCLVIVLSELLGELYLVFYTIFDLKLSYYSPLGIKNELFLASNNTSSRYLMRRVNFD